MKSRYVAGAALIVTATLPVMSTSSVSADAKIGPGERRCFTVEGEPGDAAVVNLTPVQAEGAGNGKLISSDVVNPSESSNVNFQPGTADPNVAIAPIGADGEVCFVNSNHTSVHLVADHLGTIAGESYNPALPSGEPERIWDDRDYDFKRGPESFGCLHGLDKPEGVAFINFTPAGAEGPGHASIMPNRESYVSESSTVNFDAGGVNPNVGVVELVLIPENGRRSFCSEVSGQSAIFAVFDLLGIVSLSSFTHAGDDGGPVRVADTRELLGGTRLAPNGRACFPVRGNQGDAAIVNLTPVRAEAAGDGQLVSSDIEDAPEASNVNYRPGLVDPNLAVAPIGEDGQVCFVNSRHGSVDLVADHLGTISADAYTPASPTGAPVRAIDTRG